MKMRSHHLVPKPRITQGRKQNPPSKKYLYYTEHIFMAVS